MNNELALRTIGYLIGHYKTHNETIINSQEIEAIEFIIKENQKYKEVIDKVLEDIKEYKELGYSKYYENEIEIELIDKILKVLGDD